MPGGLLTAVDSHIGGEDRSSYIRRLVTVDLQAAGKLPGSPAEEARRKAEAVILAFPDPKDASAAFDLLLITAARKRSARRTRKAA